MPEANQIQPDQAIDLSNQPCPVESEHDELEHQQPGSPKPKSSFTLGYNFRTQQESSINTDHEKKDTDEEQDTNKFSCASSEKKEQKLG